MVAIKLENVNKKFGKVLTLPNVNLEIQDKEFMVLVGPSGCGKSTTLNLIAGLEYVTEGQIYFDDQDVTFLPPKQRKVAMVFQSYALYPHMNVYDNMAFGLKLSKMPKNEIDKRIKEAASILEIEDLLDRKPKDMSGGQRQRVALGRAVVRDPSVFLFDEPLSNLDAKLRVQTRGEIIKLHKRLKTTLIYVTHDQVEAMSMADRITILNYGKIQQVGTPRDVYNNPKNLFVAGFIGSPSMNFIECEINEDKLIIDNIKYPIPADWKGKLETKSKLIFGIRPEHVIVSKSPKEGSYLVTLIVFEYLGSDSLLTLKISDKLSIKALIDGYFEGEENEKIFIHWDYKNVHLFDQETELNLLLE
jgi:multiple sugar transport system ATP-binding protein